MRRVRWSLVFLFLATAAHAADLENPRAAQQGNRAVITYDLVADEPAPVSVKASDDGGRTWDVKLEHLSGDVGDKVRPGRGKTIVWDALRDYPRGISIEALVFELSTSSGSGLPGALDGEAVTIVRKEIGKFLGGIRYLYNRELRQNPSLGGEIALGLTVGIEGDVVDCWVEDSTLDSATFLAAVCRRALKWQFPVRLTGPLRINYPLVFQP